jgi:hypothetical protein
VIKNNASRALIDRINDFNLATAFDPNATTTMMMMIRRRKEMFSVFKHKIHSFEKYLHKYQPVEQVIYNLFYGLPTIVSHDSSFSFFSNPTSQKTKTSIILILDLKLSRRKKKDSKPNFFNRKHNFSPHPPQQPFCKTSKKAVIWYKPVFCDIRISTQPLSITKFFSPQFFFSPSPTNWRCNGHL